MKKVKLGKFFKTKSGATPLTSKIEYYENARIPWLTSGEVAQYKISYTKNLISEKALNETSVKILPKDSVVIAMYGATVGEVGILNIETTTNQAVCGILPNFDEADPYYIYYQLLQKKTELIDLANGSARTNISQQIIKDFEINLPSLPTQQKIADILSALDDKIELNRKVNSELEKLARTIYDYWFLQFDFPNANGAPYRASGGVMTYSKVLKREIPDGWEVKKLGELILLFLDSTEKIEANKILSKGRFPVITQDKGEIIKGYTNSENPIQNLPVLVFGDHSCTLRYIEFPFFRGADGTQILTFEDADSTRYMYLWIKQFLPQIPSFGKYERHFKYLKDMEVVVSPNGILTQFDKQVKPIFEKIQKNNQESRELAELRDWLLPMLMNGQISV